MAVSFSHISSTIRVPLFYAELDPSQANFFQRSFQVLLIGLKTTVGTAPTNTPVRVTSEARANTLFGTGSQLASMVRTYRRNDPFTDLWCIPLAEEAGTTSLSYTITFTSNAASAGAFYFSIGGVRVAVNVTSGQTPDAVATALAAAINSTEGIVFTATAAAGAVTVASTSKGAIYTQAELPVARLQTEEFLAQAPTTMTVAVGATPTVGAGASPALTDAIANMGEQVFDAVVCPFSDTTSLDALKTEFNEDSGRWSYLRQLYGHVFAATKGTLTQRTAVGTGTGRNNPHETVLGIPTNATTEWSPTPSWQWATATAAQAARSASIDPARPFQTLPLRDCFLDQRAADTIQEQNVLLYDGISTVNVVAGTPLISRLITTYRLNTSGVRDNSYLDVTTLYTLAYLLRFMRSRITSKYPRHKLANDGTRFGEGQAIVTPSILRAELISAYAQLEQQGIVENRTAFQQNLIVERDINDPNRVNVLYPPDLVNQLRIFAVVAQFRLQYEAIEEEAVA